MEFIYITSLYFESNKQNHLKMSEAYSEPS